MTCITRCNAHLPMGHESDSGDGASFRALEHAAQLLEASRDFRVLRRFDPEQMFVDIGSIPSDARLAVVLDTETTGKNSETDKIVEISLVRFAYSQDSGKIYGVLDSYSSLEDPGVPIPPEATAVNGITEEMVAGQRIDDEVVQDYCRSADFIVAHNARFDRTICENRFEFFRATRWACSMSQVDWSEIGGTKLEYIAMKSGFFYDAHRAEIDCLALLKILDIPNSAGVRRMKQILHSLNEVTYRIWAVGSPFESRGLLKKRGYSWSDGEQSGTEKAWFTDVKKEDLESELGWLKQEIFANRKIGLPVDKVDSFTRFSNRRGQTQRIYL